MHPLSYSTHALGLAAILTLALARSQSRAGGVQWRACDLSDPSVGLELPPVECGSLPVPLDYTDHSSATTMNLELVRVPATKDSPLGNIVFNFGGPGADGKQTLALWSETLLALTGGAYNLISPVPRGTAGELNFSCYATPEDQATADLAFPFVASNSSDTTLPRTWLQGKITADTCYATQKDRGELIGTAFVARDIMEVVDALEEDGLLRYWGISYGTVLGATLAAMFPDRIDRLLLDGVLNPYEYYTNTDLETFADTDAVLSGFCAGCIADPENCVLANEDDLTAEALEARIYAMIDDFKFNPMLLDLPTGPLILDYTLVKGPIFPALYFPAKYPALATTLNDLITRNTTALTEYYGSMDIIQAQVTPQSWAGITCGDVRVRAETVDELSALFEAKHRKSRIAADTVDNLVAQCAQWRFDAKEKYAGDFQVKTRKPALIIGSTYDPATPLASARNLSSAFEGSVMLEQNGYGHAFVAQASLCTAVTVRDYWRNGTLPDPGTVCKVDVGLFDGDDGWKDVVAKLLTME